MRECIFGRNSFDWLLRCQEHDARRMKSLGWLLLGVNMRSLNGHRRFGADRMTRYRKYIGWTRRESKVTTICKPTVNIAVMWLRFCENEIKFGKSAFYDSRPLNRFGHTSQYNTPVISENAPNCQCLKPRPIYGEHAKWMVSHSTWTWSEIGLIWYRVGKN